MIDDRSKTLLKRILKVSTESSRGIEAVRFCADHEDYLDLLDTLEAERYIDRRRDRYYVRLAALELITGETPRVESLLFLCEFVFQALRQHYRESPGQAIDFRTLVERVEQPARKVAIGVTYMTEATILEQWASDSDGQYTSITPSERILKYATFTDVVDDQRRQDTDFREQAGEDTSDSPTGLTGHRGFMLRAIELARNCRSEAGKTSPKVGAVLVRDGIVIGEAYRGEMKSGEHAEYTLLERKLSDEAVAGATLYVTLEPCTSRNDPKIPCAERIVERRIRKVYIGVLDPNPNIRGDGELRLREAGIEIARFDPDLMPIIEELNRDFTRLHRLFHRRQNAIAEIVDPVKPNAVGPNGHRIGYTDDGDKVEWIPDEEDPGKEWPMLLRRNDQSILDAYDEYWNKVWWNRHQQWLSRIERGEESLTDEQKPVLEKAKRAAKQIEEKYGVESLECDDFKWGLLSGRMSALAWVMGAEWEESLDT